LVPFEGDEPPVQVDATTARLWKGEHKCIKDDGTVDQSLTLFHIMAALGKFIGDEELLAACGKNRAIKFGYQKYDGRDQEYYRIADKVAEFNDTPNPNEHGTTETVPQPCLPERGTSRISGKVPVSKAMLAARFRTDQPQATPAEKAAFCQEQHISMSTLSHVEQRRAAHLPQVKAALVAYDGLVPDSVIQAMNIPVSTFFRIKRQLGLVKDIFGMWSSFPPVDSHSANGGSHSAKPHSVAVDHVEDSHSAKVHSNTVEQVEQLDGDTAKVAPTSPPLYAPLTYRPVCLHASQSIPHTEATYKTVIRPYAGNKCSLKLRIAVITDEGVGATVGWGHNQLCVRIGGCSTASILRLFLLGKKCLAWQNR
jgi:hypothetical protein